jgi:drug/metabolite transporter (DMT)-like permease
LFSAPFYIAIAIYYTRISSYTLTQKDWAAILSLGLLGYYLSSLFDFYGLKYISASLERLILFTYPMLTVLLHSIFLKTKLRKKDYIALSITYLGIFFVFYNHHEKSTSLFLGALLVFCCAFTYAIYLVGSGQLIPKVGAQRYTSYAMLSSTIAIFLHQTIQNDLSQIFHQPLEIYLLGIGLALIATVIPSITLAESIKLIGTEKSSILATLGPLITILLAHLFLNEPFTFYQFIGAIFIISGVFIVSKK